MFLGIKTNGSSALTPEQNEKLNKIIVKENYSNYDEAISKIDDYSVDDIIFLKNSQGNYDDSNYKQGGYYKKIDVSTIKSLHENDIKNLTKRDVIDNLISTDIDKPLSANQGKEIDSILAKIYNALGIDKGSQNFSGFSGNVLSNNKNLVEILQIMADKLDKEVDYVDTYDDLDGLNKDDYAGKIVNVRNPQGSKLLGNYKAAGFYRTDGSSWIFAGTNIDDKENKFRIFSSLDDANGQKILGNQGFIIIDIQSIYYNTSSSIIEFDKDNINSNFKIIGKNYENKISEIENNIDLIEAKIHKHELMRRNQLLMSGGGDITWDGENLTISQRIIWIPTGEGQGGHINLDTCENLNVTSWDIAYLRLTDDEIKSTSRIGKNTDDILVQHYSDYEPNENDLIIGYKNGDTGHFIFGNGIPSHLIAKTKVYIQHDTRSGCPGTLAADTDINKQTIEIKHKSIVRYDFETIGKYTNRFDTYIVVDGNNKQGSGSVRHLTSTTNANWKPVSRSWTGILEPGTHTFSYRCDKADTIGCGKNRGIGRVTVMPI